MVFSLQSAGNRGYVLQLCNAIRLQADTMPPTEFLRTYLNSHEQWRNFLGDLREATLQQQTPGLGFEVRTTSHAYMLEISSPAFAQHISKLSYVVISCASVHCLRSTPAGSRILRLAHVSAYCHSCWNEHNASSHCCLVRRFQVPVVPRYFSNGPEHLGNQQPPEDGGIDHG